MGLGEAVINEIEHAFIAFSANHAARRLHDFAHAGVEIAVVMPQTLSTALLQALAHGLIDGVELRQPQRGHKSTDQA